MEQGSNDVTTSPETVAAVAKKIEEANGIARAPLFTDKEIDTVKELVAIYQGLQTFGRVAGAVRKILAYIGWMAVAYYAFRAWLRGQLI